MFTNKLPLVLRTTIVRTTVSDMKKVAAKCLTAFLGLVDQGKQDVCVNIQKPGPD